MKLSEEQIDNVNVLVSNEVKYQETYQEVFDHMLSAMEARNSMPDLQKAYREILEEDFGGHGGLEELEYVQNTSLKDAMEEKRIDYLANFLKWPGILIPLLIAVICYYGIHASKFFVLWLYLGVFTMVMVPFIFIGIGNLIIRLKKSSKKKSIKNNSLRAMGNRLFLYYIGMTIMGNFFKILFHYLFRLEKRTLFVIDAIIIVAIFLYTFLFAIAAFKAYKYEFKMRLKA